MLVSVLKSKIHRATITEADLEYVGSLTVDRDLMDASGLLPFEEVLVANISNGERFTTYVIEGERGSGVMGLNGAAARKGRLGDLIIVMAFARMEEQEAASFKPAIVIVDKDNKPTSA
jgi:aspartate 1-decarboxylase